MSRRTIWRSGEICRDHRVCRTRCWRESLVELRRQVHVATDEPRKDEFLAKIGSDATAERTRVCTLQRGEELSCDFYPSVTQRRACIRRLSRRLDDDEALDDVAPFIVMLY